MARAGFLLMLMALSCGRLCRCVQQRGGCSSSSRGQMSGGLVSGLRLGPNFLFSTVERGSKTARVNEPLILTGLAGFADAMAVDGNFRAASISWQVIEGNTVSLLRIFGPTEPDWGLGAMKLKPTPQNRSRSIYRRNGNAHIRAILRQKQGNSSSDLRRL